MNTKKILLSTIQNVREFIEITGKFDENIDVISGRHILDGKSIMGLFSLDLSKPVQAQILTDDKEIIEKFNKHISKFEVK